MTKAVFALAGTMAATLLLEGFAASRAQASLPSDAAVAAQKQKADLAAGSPVIPPTTSQARHPHAPPQPHEVRELAIKELGNFIYAPEIGHGIPQDVQQLSGMTVRLCGYMMPMDQAERITRFALVPSLTSCCFGQPPGIEHTILVDCPPGLALDYSPGQVTVQGELTVKETRQDGFVVGLFHVAAKTVQPAATP